MSKVRSSFVDESIRLLVDHFGIERVRNSVMRLAGAQDSRSLARPGAVRKSAPRGPSIGDVIESVRGGDPEKYALLTEFQGQLARREVLPESQDIRQFAKIFCRAFT